MQSAEKATGKSSHGNDANSLLAQGGHVTKSLLSALMMGHCVRRRELLRGPLYYVLMLIAATLIYWRESPVGITAVALMCGGDGFADLVGRRFGSVKLPHNRNKSWVGSLAMFLGERDFLPGLLCSLSLWH